MVFIYSTRMFVMLGTGDIIVISACVQRMSLTGGADLEGNADVSMVLQDLVLASYCCVIAS